MSRSSGRAQTEPLAALVAVFAVGVALSVYAVGLVDVLPDEAARDRDVAEPVLDRVAQVLLDGGVVDPASLSRARGVAPEGYRIRVTLTAGGTSWSTGPVAPPDADGATRTVSVRRWPGRVDPGRLRVEVWT